MADANQLLLAIVSGTLAGTFSGVVGSYLTVKRQLAQWSETNNQALATGRDSEVTQEGSTRGGDSSVVLGAGSALHLLGGQAKPSVPIRLSDAIAVVGLKKQVGAEYAHYISLVNNGAESCLLEAWRFDPLEQTSESKVLRPSVTIPPQSSVIIADRGRNSRLGSITIRVSSTFHSTESLTFSVDHWDGS